MSVRLIIARPLPGTVGETQRVVHLFPEPAAWDTLTAYCGATFGPGQLELLNTVGGMPCEICLVRSPRPRPPVGVETPDPAAPAGPSTPTITTKDSDMSIALAPSRTGRSVINDELFERLVERIVRDEDLTRPLAVRIMDQALAFLSACARDHDEPLAPSPLVDIGWHTFLVHTRAYSEFCRDIAGRFLHHEPDEPGSHDRDDAGEVRRRTLAAIQALGFTVDVDLWPHTAGANCTGCHNGCHDDPPPARP